MRTLIVLVAAAVALAGCGHKTRARVKPPPGPSRHPVVVHPGDVKTLDLPAMYAAGALRLHKPRKSSSQKLPKRTKAGRSRR